MQKAVRIGTALALRCLEASTIMCDQNKCFWFETPKRRKGVPSVFKLQEALAVAAREGVSIDEFLQCPVGAPAQKATEIMHRLLDMRLFPTECPHESLWWKMPWNGTHFYGPHLPLYGRQWMIPASRWRKSMLRYFEPSGPYITKALAHYPLQMNDVLAETWVRAVVAARIPVTQATSMVRTGRWANTLVATHLLRSTSHAQPVGKVGVSQPAFECPSHVPELGTTTTHVVGHVGDKVTHITGLPKVTQPMPLKPDHTPPWIRCMMRPLA